MTCLLPMWARWRPCEVPHDYVAASPCCTGVILCTSPQTHAAGDVLQEQGHAEPLYQV